MSITTKVIFEVSEMVGALGCVGIMVDWLFRAVRNIH